MIKRFISRSRVETRKCPRKFWHSYLQDGTGYMESTKVLDPLGFGIVVHAAMAQLFRTNDIDEALQKVDEEMGAFLPKAEENAWMLPEWEEMKFLARGILLGWYRVKHGPFIRDNEILMVEKPIETPLSSNLILFGLPDLVVRVRKTGLIKGINLKTAQSFWDWTSQWLYDVQAWTEAMSIEKELGEKVGAYEYIGLSKGSKRQGSYSSPLIYGYKEEGGLGEELYFDRYRAGREKFPVWKEDFPFGLGQEKWISWLPFSKVEEQFTSSNPIFINEGMVEEWLSQVVRWETDAQHIHSEGNDGDRAAFFEQRFSKYNCRGCPFEDVCFKKTSVGELVKAGKLMKRDSPVSRLDTMLEVIG